MPRVLRAHTGVFPQNPSRVLCASTTELRFCATRSAYAANRQTTIRTVVLLLGADHSLHERKKSQHCRKHAGNTSCDRLQTLNTQHKLADWRWPDSVRSKGDSILLSAKPNLTYQVSGYSYP